MTGTGDGPTDPGVWRLTDGRKTVRPESQWRTTSGGTEGVVYQKGVWDPKGVIETVK